MFKKLFSSKYTKFLLILVVTLVGYYALNRPWWWYSIEKLRPVNGTSAILIRESDFPWKRRWLIKQDVHQGMIWYQKISGTGFAFRPLSLGRDTVTLQLTNPDRGRPNDKAKFRSSDTFKLIATYDLEDGRELWSHNPPIQTKASIHIKALSGEHILYTFSYEYNEEGRITEVTAFQRRSGKLLWKKKLRNQEHYASLRGDSLHLQETWSHSFYNNRGIFQHRYATMDCYSGTGFWYISEPEGDLHYMKFKPFRDEVAVKGWMPGPSTYALRTCGEFKGRLFITHFKLPYKNELQISEISLKTGKQLRTRALESGTKHSKFDLLRFTRGTRNNSENGPYSRYALFLSRSRSPDKSLAGMFHVFDLQKFQVVATAITTESLLAERVIKLGNKYYIHRINRYPYLGVWNGETGRLEKAVALDYFGMYDFSAAHIKDGSIWLKGSFGRFAVLDANSLELLHRSGSNVKVIDVTEDMKKLTGLE